MLLGIVAILGHNVEAKFDFRLATMSNEFFVKFRPFDKFEKIEHA